MNNRITKLEVRTLKLRLVSMSSDLCQFQDRLFAEGFQATSQEAYKLAIKLSIFALKLQDMISILPTEEEVKNVRQ